MSDAMAAHHARTVETQPEQFGQAPSAGPATDTALSVIRRAARTERQARAVVPPQA